MKAIGMENNTDDFLRWSHPLSNNACLSSSVTKAALRNSSIDELGLMMSMLGEAGVVYVVVFT